MSIDNLRILIVAEHASLKFGGEAAIPLHYFRVLRKRGIEAWLVVHERTREELQLNFPEDFDRIYFVLDTFWHRLLWQLSKPLPQRLSYFTFGFVMRLITQIIQRHLAKQIVQEQKIDLIHQPIPVSPKEPSMIFGMGVPVVIGPINGGMNYPPVFQDRQSRWVTQMLEIGRFLASFLNILIPGKRQATTLVVANSRTRESLPPSIRNNKVVELVENGVDLSLWREHCSSQFSELEQSGKDPVRSSGQNPQRRIKFVYVGRLVNWKGVDLLLVALKQIVKQVPVELEIIGDGSERAALEKQAKELDLIEDKVSDSTVRFLGWQAQPDCAKRLQTAEALILPSLFECGGAVVLEAMAIGIPVIATKWGGPVDYLDESCGILVEPSTRESFINGLAVAMLKLAQHRELGREMGKIGYQRVLNYFDWETKIDTMLEIYRESINRWAKERTRI